MHVEIKKSFGALHWAQLNELAHFTRARVLPCAQGIFLPQIVVRAAEVDESELRGELCKKVVQCPNPRRSGIDGCPVIPAYRERNQ